MKKEVVLYKNELKNREENYNSIFSGRTKHSVGLVKPLNQKGARKQKQALKKFRANKNYMKR
jgi:hypothetical protein